MIMSRKSIIAYFMIFGFIISLSFIFSILYENVTGCVDTADVTRTQPTAR